ncbi:hypothetical protein L7F22_025214 [Adiantum nelumboides]|nr:hypothetical protein [Adiantum nelumboides]
MEIRSREELPEQKRRAQATLHFRSTKKLFQLPQKGLPSNSKTRQQHAEEIVLVLDLLRVLELQSFVFLNATKPKAQETWPPARKSKSKPSSLREELPQRLLLLEELYQSMEAAISLLRIRHEICTFSTVAAAVESSTQRRFLRSHLAQMKHILPDALQVEEYLSWDAESQSSRRDLRVTLHPISKEETTSVHRHRSPKKKLSDMVVRRKEFSRRLLDFFRKHKETDVDVPQASMLGGVTAACERELPEPLPAHVEHVQKQDEACTSLEDKVILNDCEETLDADECEGAPLPIAFNLNQLKKYPRSPTKIPQQQQFPSVPLHDSMKHLPPVFKPHFSAKRQSGVVNSDSSKAGENNARISGGVEATPQFSVMDCKLATPDRARLDSSKEATLVAVSDAFLSQIKTPANVLSSVTAKPCGNASRALLFNSPAGESIRRPEVSPCVDGVRTPKRIKLTCAHNKARPSEQATPPTVSRVFSSPSNTPANDLSSGTKKSRGNVSNFLPFNSPIQKNKAVVSPLQEDGMQTPKCEKLVQGIAKFGSSEQRTPHAVSDAFRSPIQTPVSELSSVAKKPSGKMSRVLGNVSRALPFNSPTGKRKQGPDYSSHEDRTMQTANCVKLTELQPVNFIQDKFQTSHLEKVHLADGSCATNFVDLTSLDGADKLSASDVEILKCLPQDLLNDVQAKEKKQLQDLQSGVAEKRRRQQLVAGLPKLFNMVRLIFQSGNRSVFTCKDLTKMVLSSHPDITDQGEIMEQLQLLVELAPEWISVDHSSNGDSLYRINKNADMRAVSRALVGAN